MKRKSKLKKHKFIKKDFDKALKAGLKAAEKVERSHAVIHNIPPSVWNIVLD
jgi:hypothetical protein